MNHPHSLTLLHLPYINSEAPWKKEKQKTKKQLRFFFQSKSSLDKQFSIRPHYLICSKMFLSIL